MRFRIIKKTEGKIVMKKILKKNLHTKVHLILFGILLIFFLILFIFNMAWFGFKGESMFIFFIFLFSSIISMVIIFLIYLGSGIIFDSIINYLNKKKLKTSATILRIVFLIITLIFSFGLFFVTWVLFNMGGQW